VALRQERCAVRLVISPPLASASPVGSVSQRVRRSGTRIDSAKLQ